MLRRHFAPITVALLSGGLLLAPLRADGSNNTVNTVPAEPNGLGAYTEDLHPFTHFAHVPVGADLGTIQFEKARLVKVATRIRRTTDLSYCKEAAFRDPGGSIACPYTQTEAPVPAYEVTYSLHGQPSASDEHAVRNFTFSVYLRPDELAADVQKALSGRKLSRSDSAAYFAVNTYRETAKRIAIDDKESHLCEGNYVDGLWTHTDPGCKDNISYAAVTAPSDYITVKVEPASSRMERASMVSAK